MSEPLCGHLVMFVHGKSSGDDYTNYRQMCLTGTMDALISGRYSKDNVSVKVSHSS